MFSGIVVFEPMMEQVSSDSVSDSDSGATSMVAVPPIAWSSVRWISGEGGVED